MKRIWTEGEPEFSGEFVNFSKIKSLPKPIQSPHPPLISGGSIGPKSMEFIVRNCDGWMPILGIPEWQQIKDGIENLGKRLDENNRSINSFELSLL